MSFFADIMAGGIGGLGQGVAQVAQLDMQERARAEQQAALLARYERQNDSREEVAKLKNETALQIAELKNGGSGGKGGAGMSFIDKLVLEADTPEKEAKAIAYAKMRGGTDAAARVAEFFGKPLQQTSEEFDPAAAEKLSRRDYAQANPEVDTVKTVTSKYEVGSKGIEALNRVMAMADPSKYDDYVKGERGALLIDESTKAGATIKDPVERANVVQSLSNPTTTQASVDQKAAAAEAKAAAKGAGGKADSVQSTYENDQGYKVNVMRSGAHVIAKDENGQPATTQKFEQRVQKEANDMVKANRAKYREMPRTLVLAEARRNLRAQDNPAAKPAATGAAPAAKGTPTKSNW